MNLYAVKVIQTVLGDFEQLNAFSEISNIQIGANQSQKMTFYISNIILKLGKINNIVLSS